MLRLLELGLLVVSLSAISIDQFGAKPNDDSDATARLNAEAFLKATIAANASATDRTVQVPAGSNAAHQEYWMLSVRATGV